MKPSILERLNYQRYCSGDKGREYKCLGCSGKHMVGELSDKNGFCDICEARKAELTAMILPERVHTDTHVWLVDPKDFKFLRVRDTNQFRLPRSAIYHNGIIIGFRRNEDGMKNNWHYTYKYDQVISIRFYDDPNHRGATEDSSEYFGYDIYNTTAITEAV